MFKDILKNLMEEKQINQRQLSINAGIPTTTISGWLKAERLPDYNALIKLRLFFDVSADYLLGLEDETGEKTYVNNSFNNFNNSGNFKL